MQQKARACMLVQTVRCGIFPELSACVVYKCTFRYVHNLHGQEGSGQQTEGAVRCQLQTSRGLLLHTYIQCQ